jgi:hypothetical protein
MQRQAELQSRQTNEDLQRQLRETFEEHKREELKQAGQSGAENLEAKVSAQPSNGNNDSTSNSEIISPAEQLQKSYEEHLKSLNLQDEVISGARSNDNTMSTKRTVDDKKMESIKIDKDNSINGTRDMKKRENNGADTAAAVHNETHPADEEAGTILLGFLNCLRRSYEDAVDVTEQKEDSSTEEKIPAEDDGKECSSQVSTVSQGSNESDDSTDVDDTKVSKGERGRKKRSLDVMTPQQNLRRGSIEMSEREAPFRNKASTSRSGRPAYVTDASTLSRSETSGTSNPTESSSSLEDSDSKSDKTDGSSSEESEECQVKMISRGPPRKRMKARKFTKRNLMEHSNRLQQASDESMDQSGF